MSQGVSPLMPRQTFVLLFRGVGGATQLPIAKLREELSAAGFSGVATYINSGNAVVRSELPRTAVVERVSEVCRSKLGFAKPVFALALPEWVRLVSANPFPEAVHTPKLLHAAVLAEKPSASAVGDLQRLAACAGDAIQVLGKVAYLHTPNGFGKSPLADRFDKGIGVINTARNWNTVLNLQALATATAG